MKRGALHGYFHLVCETLLKGRHSYPHSTEIEEIKLLAQGQINNWQS